MKQIRLLILAIYISIMAPINSYAIIPVVDWANGIHNQITDIVNQTRWVTDYTEYIKQTYYQLQQVQNQIQQIQYQAQSLQNIDTSSLGNLYNSFNRTISGLRSIDSNVEGLTMTYKDIDKKYDDLYLSYEKMKGNTSAQQKVYIEKAQKQIAEANKNAMAAQSINDKLKESITQLQYLQGKNQSAKGLLEASQIANEIAIRNTAEIMRLQDIMAQSMRAITSVQEAERVRNDAAKIENDRFFKYEKRNLNTSGVGLIKLQ